MKENARIYGTSEVARELGISAVWPKKGEQQEGSTPAARRDPTNAHRYYTRNDLDLLVAPRARRTGNRG